MPSTKEPDLAIAGLALLVIFGLLIWHDSPIKSDRPFDPFNIHQKYPNTSYYSHESWLWQDPFAFDLTNHTESERFYIEFNEYNKNKFSPPRKRLVFEDKSQGKNGEITKDGQCLERLTNKIEKKSVNVKILAPVLQVRPNTIENKESRTRFRHAVIAGLIDSGYHPKEPHRLNFCSIQIDKTTQVDKNDTNFETKKFEARWEYYVYKTKSIEAQENKPDILVIWIDSDALKNDSEDESESDFENFVSNLTEKLSVSEKRIFIFDWLDLVKSLKVEIIKPFSEHTDHTKQGNALITHLINELNLRRINKFSEITIITELDSANMRNLSDNFITKFKDFNQNNQPENCSDNQGSTCEIKTFTYFKGLDAYQQIIDKQDKNEDYQAEIKWSERLSINDLHNPPIGSSQLDYLHRLAEEIKKPHNEIDLINRVKGIKAVGIFGSDIYDKLLILEALRAEMPNILVFTTDLDAQMFHPQHWRWTRNLIVASPFNLQLNEKYQKNFPAFRDSQQTNIYYETRKITSDDFNSGDKIVDPLMFEIGRNGPVQLALKTPDQSVLKTPAQLVQKTSCHHTNNNFTELKRSCFNSFNSNNLTELTSIYTDITPIHPVDNRLKQANEQLWLSLGITLTLIFLLLGIRPHSGILVLWLFFSVFLIFFFTWPFATEPNEEPLSFTDGTSLWPTIIIRMIATLLAIAFIYKAICILEGNFHRLNRQYFDNREDLNTLFIDQKPRSLKALYLYVREKIKNKIKKTTKEASQTATSPSTSVTTNGKVIPKENRKLDKILSNILVTIIFLSSIFVYAFNDKNPNDFVFSFCLILLIGLGIIYFIHELLCTDVKSIKHWINKDNCYLINNQQNKQDENTCRKLILLEENDSKRNGLWKEYYEHSQLDQRLIRVTGMWLFLAIIETILFYLLPSWPSPCRGDSTSFLNSCSLDWGIGIFSFIVIMILIFFVLDAVRLSYYWIQKLRTKHPLLVEKYILDTQDTTKKDYETYQDARKDKPLETIEKIVILAAERTRVVDKLIYYPLIAIMLMLFARITYFDNQDFPLSKGITFAASFSLLLFAGFMIRVEAEKLRAAALKSAESLVGYSNLDNNATIRRIREINTGIFQPMLDQPVMRALLIILASVGLFASEYLMLFG